MRNILTSLVGVGLLALILWPASDLSAYTTLGGTLPQGERSVRVYNNFADPSDDRRCCTGTATIAISASATASLSTAVTSSPLGNATSGR